MHEVISKGILSSNNGMNIYRGCTHGCIYCDARSLCYGMNHVFENIEVKVLRDGEVELVSKSELVPGDIVFIETGDMIPADGRLIKSINLKVREDMLTGESDDVSKKCDAIIGMEKVETKDGVKELEPIPAKQINMVFGGTLVAYGTGMMVVTSIGDNTQMGDIAKHLSGDEEDTPLQIKLGNLGGMIAKISSAIAGLLFIFMVVKMVLNGLKVDTSNVFAFLDSIDEVKTAFTVCVALIVAAVPEGLPTMINMTLAITMQKMAKINALVTKKEACETIGSVSVICSDKTGTLTQNRMTVEVAYIDGRYVEDKIESNSYFLENCTINSTADIEINEDETKYLGSATECALLLRNKDVDYRKMRNEAIIIAQNQFSSNLKRMSTIITENNKYVLLTKGAPEIVLELCKYVQEPDGIKELTKERKEKILSEIAKLQEKSMRALGFAYKEMSLYDESQEAAVALEEEEISIEKCEESLVFGGFVGIRDPLRPDVKEAVDTAHHAGVSVKMLTGDNINTARAIGEDLGLLKNNMRAVEASYIDTLTDEELREEIKKLYDSAESGKILRDGLKTVIIGKPNVGKSSLINKLLGEDRVIVSDIAGTTRDAVDAKVKWKDREYIFIDTAGLRRKGKIKEEIERYSVIRTVTAVERADVVAVVIDATEGVTEQDAKIAGIAHERGKGVIIAVNKWDAIEKDNNTVKQHTEKIRQILSFIPYAEILFISAKSGQRLNKIFELIDVVIENNSMRVATGVLNEIVTEAVAMQQPPTDKGKRLKIYYVTQVSVKPPTFVIFVNDKNLMHFSYTRYLENRIRDTFGFRGTALKFITRERKENE